jgi:hypothetical protein
MQPLDRIGDVQYYFQAFPDNMNQKTRTFAVVSVWSLPHPELWEQSYRTCYSSVHRGQDAMLVLDVTEIQTVVAMVPHEVVRTKRLFLVEKIGLSLVADEHRRPEPFDEDMGDGQFWDQFGDD